MHITQHILQFSFSLKISILMPLWLDNSENYILKLLILNILELLVVNFGAHDLPQIDGKGLVTPILKYQTQGDRYLLSATCQNARNRYEKYLIEI